MAKKLRVSFSYLVSRVCSLKMLILYVAILVSLSGAVLYWGDITNATVSLDQDFLYKSNSSVAALSTTKRSVISVPSGMVKAHPFLPYRDIDGSYSMADIPDLELVPPPESVNADSIAARVMDTIVSGILFDKYSPSAILNIEGNDYLVKKGDVVNGYNVLNIAQDSVTVKLGSNVYKAGIGEILTEGEMNYNEVSNLSNKFGGVRE